MGAEQNIATIKAMYDASGRGDITASRERVTDDPTGRRTPRSSPHRGTAPGTARTGSAVSSRGSRRLARSPSSRR